MAESDTFATECGVTRGADNDSSGVTSISVYSPPRISSV